MAAPLNKVGAAPAHGLTDEAYWDLLGRKSVLRFFPSRRVRLTDTELPGLCRGVATGSDRLTQ